MLKLRLWIPMLLRPLDSPEVTSRFQIAELISARYRSLLILALVSFVALIAVLRQYYTPIIVVPLNGDIRAFQVYVYNQGYTERNSFFRNGRHVNEVDRTITELRFPAHERFRLDFLQTRSAVFPGIL